MTRRTLALVVLTALAMGFAGWIAAGLARGAAPADCEHPYNLKLGEKQVCAEHASVPAARYAQLLKAESDLGDAAGARAKAEAALAREQALHQADLEQRDGEVIGLQTQLARCEAAHVPEKCPQTPLLAQPGFAYPMSLTVGFIGGLASSRSIFPCR